MDRPDLKRFFAPRSVALVGASADPAKFGGRCFRQLRDFGYEGRIFPINPRLDTLDGLPCFPDIASLPETPDHVGIVVPSAAILDTIHQCGDRGVPFATIFSSGFAEGGGAAGAALQREIVDAAKRSGLRFMGPNCNGLVNYVDGFALTSTATINGPRAPAGDVAVLGHSGGLAQVNVMWRAQEAGLGISYQVSCGNDADLDILDYARFAIRDTATRVVLILAETLRDGGKLRRLADEAKSAGKPIVMMKLGRTEDGRKAAVSHTGALAGSDAVADDVLRQLGIVRVNDCHEMIEAASLLRAERRFTGRRLAAISISGGNLVHLADQGPLEALRFPAFSPQTQERLRALIPNYGQAHNPADVTSAAIGTPAIFSGVMEAIAADPEIDAVIPVLTLHSRQIVDAAANAVTGCGKPFAMVWSGGCSDDPALDASALMRRGIPVFRDIAPAMRALNRAVGHAEFLARPAMAREEPEIDAAALCALAESLPAEPDEVEAKRFLRAAGVAVPEGVRVADGDEAAAAAERLGGALAVKLVSSKAAHKTELGGVRLGLCGGAAVRGAAEEIEAALRTHAPHLAVEGYLVERMAAPGTEMILGLSRDPVLGSVLTAGFGGIQAELLQDVAHRMLPIDAAEARSMLRQLRGWPLLDGFRGRPKADVDALVALMLRVSQIGEVLGDAIEALDLNPVIVGAAGEGALACDALLVRA